MKTLLSFLRELDKVGAHYSLAHYRVSDVPLNVAAITVHVTASATERWEVEFSRTERDDFYYGSAQPDWWKK